ncbi:MAG: hypothetical protein E4H14_05610 [Candidatus Thorarchaeota archaeon]|nr:MAG: hypothetical protein E4H14_05610 [Candidatus Thorarchaeota archaeon]
MAGRSDKVTTGRYVQGGSPESYSKRIGWWERVVWDQDPTDVQFTITRQYSTRPDLLAFDIYGSTLLDFFLLQYNNILDINEEFVEGKVILLPLRGRVFSEMLTRQDPLTFDTK